MRRTCPRSLDASSRRLLRRATILPTLLVAYSLLGLPLRAKVRVVRPTDFDFAAVRTFAWTEPRDRSPEDPLAASSPVGQRLRAVGEQLLARRSVMPAEDPDIHVRLRGVVMDQLTPPGKKTSLASGVSWEAMGDMKSWAQGHLLVEVLEPETGRLLWAGSDEIALAGDTLEPEKIGRKAEKLLRRILRRFPEQ